MFRLRSYCRYLILCSFLSLTFSFASVSFANNAKRGDTQIIKTKRFRTGSCWRLYKKTKKDYYLQRRLLQKRLNYQCDPKAWRKCKRNPYNRFCRQTSTKKRWYACFYIERRLFVILERMAEYYKEAKEKKRCRWRLKFARERFKNIRFEPAPQK